MRLVVTAAIAAVLLAATPAVAQLPDAGGSGLHVAMGSADPVMPVTGVGNIALTVTIDCSLVIGAAPDGATVTMSATAAPTWATVVFDPFEFTVAPDACGGATTTQDVTAIVTADATAPAFQPETLEVQAATETAGGGATATNSTGLEAAFYSALTVDVQPTTAEGGPGASLDYTITVTNAGNGATMVMFQVGSVPTGWNATIESPMTVAVDAAGEAVATVRLPADATVDAEETIQIAYTSHFADDASISGLAGNLNLQATLKAPVQEEEGNGIPIPPLLPLVATLGAAIIAARRD